MSEKVNPYVLGGVNQNLLDNWYFGNPVNQRGQTEYATLGYTIDRWKLERGSIAVENGYITLQNAILRILFDDELFTVDNQKATFSILTKDGSLTSYTFSVPDGKYADAGAIIGTHVPNAQVGHLLPKGSFFVINIPSASVDIVAIKVEYGTIQTLAHQENGVWVLNEVPDYGTELAKCQRYQVYINDLYSNIGTGFSHSGKAAYIMYNLPNMRTKPTVSFQNLYMLSGAHFGDAGVKVTSLSELSGTPGAFGGTANCDGGLTKGEPIQYQLRGNGCYFCADANL